MKSLLLTIFPLSLLTLVGCGVGGQSETKLQVSHAFAMTNPYFGGGLIISGRNLTTGKSFSKGLTNTMEFKTSLDQGTWLITAVGWDGGSTSNVMYGGLTYCGKIQKEIIYSVESVDLSISQLDCLNPIFAGGANSASFIDTTTTPDTLKPIELINTCNTFFEGSVTGTDAVYSKLVTAGPGNANFCENSVLGLDQRSNVGGIKIYSMNKDLTQSGPTLGFSSECINSETTKSITYPTNGGYTSFSKLRLPMGGIPFTIVTFEDSVCDKPIAHFPFKNGLLNGDPALFDHSLLGYNANDLKLILPANDLRRAISPFSHLLPFVKRWNTGSVVPFIQPTIPAYDIRGVLGVNKAILENVDVCTNPLSSSANISATPTCVDLGDKVEITFTATAVGAGTITMDSINYAVFIEDGTQSGRSKSLKLAMELLGHDGDESISNFFGLKQNDNQYGVLSEVRSMFSGDGAGGVLGVPNIASGVSFIDACLNALADKSIVIFNHEKMRTESYRVIISNNVVGAPTGFICDNTDMNATTASCTNFDKRMTIFDHKISTIKPAMVLEFHCTEMFGRMEMNSVDIEGVVKTETKQVINWNTNTNTNLSFQRFERILWEKVYFNNIFKDQRRNTSRIIKRGSDDYEAWSFNFRSHLATLTDQKLDYRRLKTDGTFILDYVSQSAQVTNADPTFILTDPSYATLRTRTPLQAADAATDAFTPNNAYPASTETIGATLYDLTTDFNNSALLFNDSLNFNLDDLNSAGFTGTFAPPFAGQ